VRFVGVKVCVWTNIGNLVETWQPGGGWGAQAVAADSRTGVGPDPGAETTTTPSPYTLANNPRDAFARSLLPTASITISCAPEG